MPTPIELLRDTFGYSQFRNQQEEIINAVIGDTDVLVIMPTGGGKSLCYQIPAMIRGGLTVVISPLIALMDDQVAALRQLDIAAAALHSNVRSDEKRIIHQQIEDGTLKLLYVSPEGLMVDRFIHYLKSKRISLFAIDEAHCVSVWGNDFRPEYVRLSELKTHFPKVPKIALTATADHATQSDIIDQLQLTAPRKFLSSFERPNITTIAKAGQKRIQQITNFLLSHQNEAGIVYCLSRKSTEKVAEDLRAQGYRARAYHAGVDSQIRSEIQKEFQSDDIQIVCATIAFGMGIDKPNIRWVIHYNMPKNIEGYYQEIGRGGRDGDPAEALLFYSWADFINLQRFIDASDAEVTFREVQRAKLERIWELATASSCRTNLVLNYFGEYRSTPCQHCDNCLHPPELFDGTRYAQMVLSAIIRTKETMALNLLIDVLRGSYRQEVKAAALDRIKTFGVGREVPFLDWKHYITQMINQGVVSIDYTDGSRLKTTPLSAAVLQGDLRVSLSKFEPQGSKPKIKVPKLNLDMQNMDDDLLDKLKNWRGDLASQQSVPAYVILSNKTLQQISATFPSTIAELLAVDGIGQVKLKKYGEQILNIVKAHQNE